MDDEGIDCDLHGEGVPYGFVCGHLLGKAQVGWVDGEDEELCPDAWCEDCEQIRLAAGEWNEENEEALDVTVVCACCYHRNRGRQRRFAGLDPATAASLTASACEHIQLRNDSLEADHGLFSNFPWRFDLEKAELVFLSGGKARFRCRIAAVGSYSDTAKNWLWAWDNSSLPIEISARSHAVLGYAERTGRDELSEARTACTLDQAWQHAAVGAALMEAAGLYRCPFENLHAFFALLDVKPVGRPSRR
jgi:hypothetical protein